MCLATWAFALLHSSVSGLQVTPELKQPTHQSDLLALNSRDHELQKLRPHLPVSVCWNLQYHMINTLAKQGTEPILLEWGLGGGRWGENSGSDSVEKSGLSTSY